jgi:hypothetical protein
VVVAVEDHAFLGARAKSRSDVVLVSNRLYRDGRVAQLAQIEISSLWFVYRHSENDRQVRRGPTLTQRGLRPVPRPPV